MKKIITCLYSYLSEHFGDKNEWVEFGVIDQTGLRLHIPEFLKRNIILCFNIYKLPEFLRQYPKVELQQYEIDNFNHFNAYSLVLGVFFRPLVAIYCCCVASFYFLSEFFIQNTVHLELWSLGIKILSTSSLIRFYDEYNRVLCPQIRIKLYLVL